MDIEDTDETQKANHHLKIDPIRVVIENDLLLKSYLLSRLIKNSPKSTSSSSAKWSHMDERLDNELLMRLARLFCDHHRIGGVVAMQPTAVVAAGSSRNQADQYIYAYLLGRYQREVDPRFCLSGSKTIRLPPWPPSVRSNQSSIQVQDESVPNNDYYLFKLRFKFIKLLFSLKDIISIFF